MDQELEDQIDEILHKATKDIKAKISRVVSKHQNKLLKDQAKELKSGVAPSTRKVAAAPSSGTSRKSSKVAPAPTASKKSSKKDYKYSDSDSDGYYSD